MKKGGGPTVRVSMLIDAPPKKIFDAFVQPQWLTQFWLSKASGSLSLGQTVEWEFMVAGASDTVTATQLDPGNTIAWTWSDGAVRIELEPIENGTAVTLVCDGFAGDLKQQTDAALMGPKVSQSCFAT